MIINLFLILLCGILWRLGGWKYKPARRIGIPVIPAVYFAITARWWLFFIEGAVYGLTIPIGYGAPSPDDPKPSWLGKVFKIDWLIRAIYGLIVAGMGALPLLILKYITPLFFVIYLALNFLIGVIVVKFKLRDILAEVLVGMGVASIIFWKKKK